jgi:ligand-binding sensor domain-containing protein
VMSLLFDQAGRLWVGTFEGGLNQLDPATGRFRRSYPTRRIPRASAGGHLALLEDRDGRLWVGCSGAGSTASTRDRHRVHYRSVPGDATSLSSDAVIALAQDREGMIWVGTDGGGLDRFDPEKRQGHPASTTSPRAGLPQQRRGLRDSRGPARRPVGGHPGRRLNRWRAKDRAAGPHDLHAVHRARRSRERHGLRLLEEDSGTLWLSTNHGLSRLDPRPAPSATSTRATVCRATSSTSEPTTRRPTGEMFFGGIDGFNSFVPSRVASERERSPRGPDLDPEAEP